MRREIILTTSFSDPGSERALHFEMDDRNCVSWKVVPEGESGLTRPFRDIVGAEGFMARYAERLGFAQRLVTE